MTPTAPPVAIGSQSVTATGNRGERTFAFRSSQLTRDVIESPTNPFTETGSDLFDGPFGPPVVWPQESTVAIYHNHAIWPFVTAYWAKSARHCGHEAAVASAIDSITTAAVRHLSNMENLDVRSGDLDGHSHGLVGPDGQVVEAGYVTMPQTGGWEVFQLSSGLTVTVRQGGHFVLKLFEDVFSRNMSYFAHNAVYTAHDGGGPTPCNRARIDGVILEAN